ncbi:MAG: SurA N-terminal domain-containing protein [Oceanicaulis sp.]
MLSAIRKAARSPIFGGFIIALLIAAFALFGVTDIFRAGGTAAVIVGPERVSVRELNQAFERQMMQIQRENPRFTREQAEELGLGERMVQVLTAQAALDAKAGELGLSLSDDQLIEALQSIQAFNNPFTNAFDHQAYLSVLAENGYRGQAGARLFEAQLAEELTRGQLIDAVLGGVRAPQVMAAARRAYEQERRRVRALLIPPSLAGDVADPTDEQLEAFIAENAGVFTRPEGRRFTLVRVRPDMFQQDVDISEDDLRQLYEFRRENGELAPPATRSFTQWPAPDEASAQAAAARIAGEEFAPEVVEDLGLGDPVSFDAVEAFQVPDADVAERVFALQEGEAAAVQSRLGWRVVRVSAADDPVVPSFEETRPELERFLAGDQAEADMLDALGVFEEARAAGATLEEAGRTAELPVERFDFLTRQGTSLEGEPAVTLMDAPEILEAVFTLTPGFAGDVTNYSENGYFVARVDAIEESRLPRVDEVREQASTFWRARQVDDALTALVEDALDRARAGEDLADIARSIGAGAQVEMATLGRGETAGPFNRQLVGAAFNAVEGEPFEARAGDQRTRAVAVVEDVIAPGGDPVAPERRAAITGELSDDLAAALESAVLSAYEIRRDPLLIDQALGRAEPAPLQR